MFVQFHTLLETNSAHAPKPTSLRYFSSLETPVRQTRPPLALFEKPQPPEVYDNIERMLNIRLESSREDLTIDDFNDMIIGFGKAGQQERSLRLFELALREEFVPNEDTYIGLMEAFGNVGDTDNALETFNQLLLEQTPTQNSVGTIINILVANKETDTAFEFLKKYPHLAPIECFENFVTLKPFRMERIDRLTTSLLRLGRADVYSAVAFQAVRAAVRDSQPRKVMGVFAIMTSLGVPTNKVIDIVMEESPEAPDWDLLMSLVGSFEDMSPLVTQGLINSDPERALAFFLKASPNQLTRESLEYIIASKLKEGDLNLARKYLQTFLSKFSIYTPRICNALLQYHGERKEYGELKHFLELAAVRSEISNERTFRLLIKYFLRSESIAEAVRAFQIMIRNFPAEATQQDFQTMMLICAKHQLSAAVLSLSREQRRRFSKEQPPAGT
jgi:tetratricopeptide (TPR) repeat protein